MALPPLQVSGDVVRLNAHLMPVRPLERELCRLHGIQPREVEAADPDEILRQAAHCDALFVVSAYLPRPVIEGLERCRVISRLGNGTDRIDVEAARDRGILVTNVPYFCVEEMADHVLATLLMLVRQIPETSRAFYAGAYAHARRVGLALPRVRGLTLGLIGFGASARAVAERARPFGLRVIATRRNRSAPTAEAEALGVEMTDLDTVLRQSDILSLHLPLSRDTHHLLDASALDRMKPGAYLINTSRGALVDEEALWERLRDGRLAGAALDVFEEIAIFEENPPAPTHPLVTLGNVVLTPHVSGLSAPAGDDVSRTGVENLVSVLAGYWPPEEHIVNAGVTPRIPLQPYCGGKQALV